MEPYNYYLYSSRKSYGAKPDFRVGDDLPNSGFTSLYAVTSSTASALVQEGTTRLFKGVVWAPTIKIDVDSYEAAGRTECRIKELGLSYRAYDSGGKGAHFEIPRMAFPSQLLPYKDKQWVKANFPEADTSIYTHLHPFRLEGTIHEETGKKKELVSQGDGEILRLPDYDLASNIVNADSVVSNNSVSVFSNFRIMSETMPQEGGERHYSLVRLCYALRDFGLTASTALWWMLETNKMYSERKDDASIEKIVQSIFT